MLEKAVSTQDVTNPVSFSSFNVCMMFLYSLTLYNTSSFVSPTDFLHPAPAPHFTTLQVFLIYRLKRPISSTTQS
jgi:hypothetical protein